MRGHAMGTGVCAVSVIEIAVLGDKAQIVGGVVLVLIGLKAMFF